MSHAAIALLADAGGQAPTDPTGVFLQYGAIGAMVVILGLFAWSAYKRERDRGDRLEEKLQQTNERIAEKYNGVLADVLHALVDVNDYLRDLTHRRR